MSVMPVLIVSSLAPTVRCVFVMPISLIIVVNADYVTRHAIYVEQRCNASYSDDIKYSMENTSGRSHGRIIGSEATPRTDRHGTAHHHASVTEPITSSTRAPSTPSACVHYVVCNTTIDLYTVLR